RVLSAWTLAGCLTLTLAAATGPAQASAGTTPTRAGTTLPRASTAAAGATESRALLGHRGVPEGSAPQASMRDGAWRPAAQAPWAPGGVPEGSAPQASMRDGAWRLAAQAPSAPRGVPGGSAPQASTVRLPPPRHAGTLRVTGALRDGGTVRAA